MNIDKFSTFLKISGAEILEPTNPYELIRFRTLNGVSVIYTGRRGHSYTNEAKEAYDKFQSKGIWEIKGRAGKQKDAARQAILERDGPNCFYCSKTLPEDARTIEHLLSIEDGGNNNLKNLVFACTSCNSAVGSSSIIEKVKYREALQGGK